MTTVDNIPVLDTPEPASVPDPDPDPIPIPNPDPPLPSQPYTKLVLSGGGIKGIVHLGALAALDELNILSGITMLAGSSVGALILVLTVIGYKPKELYSFISLLDVKNLTEINFMNLFNLYGLDDGSRFELVLNKLFINKNLSPGITFKELYEKTNKTIYISAVCLNDKKTYYFSHINNPNMSVLLAVRMSIAIPIFFVPVSYQNKLYIDGACMDNYPIHLFDKLIGPDKPTLSDIIGIYLKDIQTVTDTIDNIESLFIHTINCLFEGVANSCIRNYDSHTNIIMIENISSVDFNLSQESKLILYNLGYNQLRLKYK
jgi:hypothetical protein